MYKPRPLIHVLDEILIPPDVDGHTKRGGKINSLKFARHFHKIPIDLKNPRHPT